MKNTVIKKIVDILNSKKNILFEKIHNNYKDKNDIVPSQITIEISGNCNAKCPFCPRQVFEMDLKGFMPKEIFYNIIKQIKQIPTIKTVSLAALGEPLLHPNFDEFVEYLTKLNYEVMFPTNMSLAHKHFHTLLKAKRIIYSIEGHDKESYEKLRRNLNFEQVYKNVKVLDELIKEKRSKEEHSPARLLNFIITKNSEIKTHIELWGDYVDAINIRPIGHPLKWDKNLKTFIPIEIEQMQDEIFPKVEKTEKTKCTQPFELIVIRPDGKLSLCCCDTGCDLDFGDYRNLKKSFFKNKNLNKVREEFRKNNIEICKNCTENFVVSKDTLIESLPELNGIENKKIRIN